MQSQSYLFVVVLLISFVVPTVFSSANNQIEDLIHYGDKTVDQIFDEIEESDGEIKSNPNLSIENQKIETPKQLVFEPKIQEVQKLKLEPKLDTNNNNNNKSQVKVNNSQENNLKEDIKEKKEDVKEKKEDVKQNKEDSEKISNKAIPKKTAAVATTATITNSQQTIQNQTLATTKDVIAQQEVPVKVNNETINQKTENIEKQQQQQEEGEAITNLPKTDIKEKDSVKEISNQNQNMNKRPIRQRVNVARKSTKRRNSKEVPQSENSSSYSYSYSDSDSDEEYSDEEGKGKGGHQHHNNNNLIKNKFNQKLSGMMFRFNNPFINKNPLNGHNSLIMTQSPFSSPIKRRQHQLKYNVKEQRERLQSRLKPFYASRLNSRLNGYLKSSIYPIWRKMADDQKMANGISPLLNPTFAMELASQAKLTDKVVDDVLGKMFGKFCSAGCPKNTKGSSFLEIGTESSEFFDAINSLLQVTENSLCLFCESNNAVADEQLLMSKNHRSRSHSRSSSSSHTKLTNKENKKKFIFNENDEGKLYEIHRKSPKEKKQLSADFWQRFQEISKENGTNSVKVMSEVVKTAEKMRNGEKPDSETMKEWALNTAEEQPQQQKQDETNLEQQEQPKQVAAQEKKSRNSRHPLSHPPLRLFDDDDDDNVGIDVKHFEEIKKRKSENDKKFPKTKETIDRQKMNEKIRKNNHEDLDLDPTLKSKQDEADKDEPKNIDMEKYNKILKRHLDRISSKVKTVSETLNSINNNDNNNNQKVDNFDNSSQVQEESVNKINNAMETFKKTSLQEEPSSSAQINLLQEDEGMQQQQQQQSLDAILVPVSSDQLPDPSKNNYY